MSSTLRDQLQAIYEKRGQLTPAVVVDEARDPDHPFHSRFEWDDSIAGEAWRREQAHRLIRSVKIVYRNSDEQEIPLRAFHAVRTEQGHIYEPSDKVADSPFLTELVLRDMEREWRALYARYQQFAEFIALIQRDTGLIAAD